MSFYTSVVEQEKFITYGQTYAFYLFLWLISLRSKLSVLMEVWKNHGAPSPKATVNDFVELLI